MQDDFDRGMGMPDEEIGGGSTTDLGDPMATAGEGEVEGGSEPAGRPSGGARARKSAGGGRKPAARKAAPAKKKAAKKSKPAKKAKKAAKKSSKKAAKKGKKKAGKKR